MDLRHVDPGLQPERTSMSWTRTTLSALLVATLTLKFADEYGATAIPTVLVVALLAVTALATHRRRFSRSVRGLTNERLRPPTRSVFLLGGAVVLLGALSFAVVVTHAFAP